MRKNKKDTVFSKKEIEGTVQGHRDGHGFVVSTDDTPDLYLPPNEMHAVMHRDKVKARITGYDRKGRPEGRVVEIMERKQHPIIGRLLQESGIWLVAPEDKRYGQDIIVDSKNLSTEQIGQVVVVELSQPPALYGQPVGVVKEVLGHVNDPGMEIEIAVRKYGMPHVFSDACQKLANKLPEHVLKKDWRGRVDLTDIPLLTIDGEDARDFDDAVYCEPAVITGRGKKPNGWRLLVAIADVSHYVQNGNAIDVDAYDRATSVYFPRRVIPMLPEKLSNGLCSLNPHVDRLCMVCDMLITPKGEIHAYQFYPAVMHSHARLTYTEVAAIIANTQGEEAQNNAEHVPHLLNLHGVYQSLQHARQQRSALELETVETQIVCDDDGRIEKIVPRTRNDAHKLIEEAMLAANVCAADFIGRNKKTGLYRVHEGPTPEKVEILRSFLRTMGIHAQVSDEPQPQELAAIAQMTQDREDAQQIHTMLLRSMQQAMYTPDNNGHFGLAYSAYTHFTSPIRRYPDLLVHRVIKSILNGEKYHLPTLPTPGEAHEKLNQRLQKNNSARQQTAKPQAAPKANSETLAWQAAGLHCSANERRADEASKDVEAWLKCKYIRNFLGETFEGTVSAVTSFGIFVTLQDMFVEGLVHVTELGNDYFTFDETRQELRGERNGTRFALGNHVRVQVVRVDLDSRRIDFRLVAEHSSSQGFENTGKNRQTNARKAATQTAPKAERTNTHTDARAKARASKGRGSVKAISASTSTTAHKTKRKTSSKRKGR